MSVSLADKEHRLSSASQRTLLIGGALKSLRPRYFFILIHLICNKRGTTVCGGNEMQGRNRAWHTVTGAFVFPVHEGKRNREESI